MKEFERNVINVTEKLKELNITKVDDQYSDNEMTSSTPN